MAGPITISVIGDTRSLVGGLDAAGGRLGKLGGQAGRAGKAIAKGLAIGVAAAGAATVAFLASSTKSLVRIERIGKQTESVIKSTGAAAGVTRDHVDKLAGTLENLTATEAESITEGANMLLTFTGIRNGVGKSNQIFDQAVGTITDMSRALDKTGGANIDTTKTAVQLGKALNDPVKGITALSKVGVSFTEGQKKQIKSFVESGKTMEAQKVILAELKKEFGGAGEAFGKSTAGKIELAKHALGTFGESLASGLLPVLGKLATQATKGLAWLDTKAPAIKAFASGVLDDLKPGLAVIGNLLRRLGAAFVDVAPDILAAARAIGDRLGDALASLEPFLRDVAAAFVTDIIPAAKDLGRTLKTQLGPVFSDIGNLVVTGLLPALQDIALYVYRTVIPAALNLVGTIATYLGPVLAAIVPIARSIGQVFVTNVIPAAQALGNYFTTNVAPILTAIGDLIVTKLVPSFQAFAQFVVTTLVPVVVDIATKVGTNLKPILDQLTATFTAKVLPALTKLAAKFEEWRPTIQAVIVVVAKVIGKVLEFASSLLGKVLPPLIRVAAFLVGNFIGSLGQVIGTIVKVIKKAVEFGTAFVDTLRDLKRWVEGVKDKGREVVRYVGDIPGKITSAIGDLGGLLRDAGVKLIQGFIDGIDSMFGKVQGKLQNLTGKLTSWKGPPKRDAILLRGAGRLIIQGLINGFADQYKNVEYRLGKLTDLIARQMDANIREAQANRDAIAGAKKVNKARLKLANEALEAAKKNAKASKTLVAGVDRAITRELRRVQSIAAAYSAAKKARAAYAAGVREAALATANITQVGATGENGAQTSASILQGLRDRLNAILNFNAKVKALAKAGLRKDLLEQIIAAGVEGGTATAEALQAGGAAAIKSANYVQGQIAKAATGLGITATNAVLAPLDKDKVTAAANRAAKIIASILRAKLGIRVDVRIPGAATSRGRTRVATGASATPARRTAVTTAAVAAGRSSSTPQRFQIELTAEQLDAIARGRRVTADIRAYKKAGGR